jgi:hypothetical protein
MPEVDAFNIEKFKSKFGDGAKGGLFYFRPAWPAGITADVTTTDAIYLVKTATVPTTTLAEDTLAWQGMDYKYAGKRTYGDLAVNFNVDISAKIRMLFERWSNFIHDPSTNLRETSSNYMVDQKLQMVGYDGQVILEFTMHHAWPKDIGSIALDYSSADTVTFDVTFSYIYHTLSFSETGGVSNTAG